jgi:hypothetical protein
MTLASVSNAKYNLTGGIFIRQNNGLEIALKIKALVTQSMKLNLFTRYVTQKITTYK